MSKIIKLKDLLVEQPPQPQAPGGGGDETKKLKINIPDSPFEDDKKTKDIEEASVKGTKWEGFVKAMINNIKNGKITIEDLKSIPKFFNTIKDRKKALQAMQLHKKYISEYQARIIKLLKETL